MKTLSVILILASSCFLFAQSPVDKGTWNIGGDISFSSTTHDNSNTSVNLFSFNPTAGYFFIDKFSAGLLVNFSYESYGSNSRNGLGIGPSIRYYFTRQEFIPFAGFSFQYLTIAPSSGSSITGDIMKFTFGADYFVAKNVAFEGSINYLLENQTYPAGPISEYERKFSSKQFSIAIGLNIFLY